MPLESSALRVLLTTPNAGLLPCIQTEYPEIAEWTSNQARIGNKQGFFQLLEGEWNTEQKLQQERDIVSDRMLLGLALQIQLPDNVTVVDRFFDMNLQAADYRHSLSQSLKHWRRCPKSPEIARILVPMSKEEERITVVSNFKTENQTYPLMGIWAEFSLKYRVEYQRTYPDPTI